ncbi:hypothetical protein EV702DRAFT_1191271 [Suillus placidus]|uniref:Uncharacterized protein n=1 Tax=Suillus placidus TaxID=48579 RepID=A0A9P7A8W6_9AGAM|nr:hypothetical protein EV702DRAFT_1191271 [Suillus placidus]
MSDTSFLYKAKHNNVIVDSRIMLVLVIVYYVLLFIAIYFPHEFTDDPPSPHLKVGSIRLSSGAMMAYGIARLWDLRSTKGAVTSFRVWDGMKVLAVDWVGDVVGIGSEDGMEVWRIAGGS